MLFPIAIAIHSPGAVVPPVCIGNPGIAGDHARLVISLWPVKAIDGSVTTRFFTSGRGELRRGVACACACAAAVCGAMSQSSTWQSSPKKPKRHIVSEDVISGEIR
jgi:hypothetical protein